MNREPILFRVDGTRSAGWEHLARCQTLAQALQRRRRPTYFLSQLEPGSLGLAIKRAGNDWLAASNPAGSDEDLDETIRAVRRLRPAAVLVDAPAASSDYLTALQETGTVVVSLDSAATQRYPSRLVINPLLGPGRDSYEPSPGTQLLLGSRYALVRSEIRRVRALRAQEQPEPYRVLVALGDDDPNIQAGELARLLLNTPRVGRVDILARSYHPQLEELQALAAASNGMLEIATEPAETAARVARCHMALTAGNGWSLELACVGVPQLMLVQSEAHWPTAHRLEEEGAGTCLGWYANTSAGTIRQAVQDLLADPLERRAMSRCGRKLIDGRGCDRLVTGLEVLLHSARRGRVAQAA